MSTELTWKEAINKVLAEANEPLHYQDITDRIIASKYRVNLGATPGQTVNAQIVTSINNDGDRSPYIRVSKGVFMLKSSVHIQKESSTHLSGDTVDSGTEIDEPEEIITSFGMFWRREAIEWIKTPKVLGEQRIESNEVNFCNQIGIYLLYDGREIIYVGRTIDRPLGVRLYEHTIDRLSTRWNRFSWFGFKPVNNEGKLGDVPANLNSEKIISSFEAVLIEALEPRQNRKRGDDLSVVEYIQKEDPDIMTKKLKLLQIN